MHPRQAISDLPYLLKELKIKHIVISPGSRSAPLTIQLVKSNCLQCISVPDERSAAFIAIGIARTSQAVVALVCTSGTAPLNYSPAIAEAYYQEVPLLILTADRPPELIDQYDGQTIHQSNIYAPFIKRTLELPVETNSETELYFAHRLIYEAVQATQNLPRGPVHVNIPLREPLYNESPVPSVNNNKILQIGQVDSFQISKELVDIWQQSAKKLIVAGMGDFDESVSQHLLKLAKRPDTVVMAENLSNYASESFISCHDRLLFSLNEELRNEFSPDLLITFGGPILSKQLKLLLRKYSPNNHLHIDPSGRCIDTFQSITYCIQANTSSFFKEVLNVKQNSKSSYNAKIISLNTNKRNIHNKILQQISTCDLKVFQKLMENLPQNCILQLGNSTPVRYSQFFESRKDITYYSNRGVSGIDGCLSTAVGCALATHKIVTIILGDISFLYDSNALWSKHLPQNLRIILVNNNGGDIFRVLDTNNQINSIEEFFTTPHQVNISELCKAYSLPYDYCKGEKDLTIKLQALYSYSKASLLEIDTKGFNNAGLFKEYINQLKSI